VRAGGLRGLLLGQGFIERLSPTLVAPSRGPRAYRTRLRIRHPRATSFAARGIQVLGKFRESSGKSEGRREMAADRQFAFGSFRFDARTGQLWRDGREVKLTLGRPGCCTCWSSARRRS
jgi:hypothetical protein